MDPLFGTTQGVPDALSLTLWNVACVDEDGTSKFSVMVANIRRRLTFDYNFKVKFIKRQANMTIHSRARVTISYACRHEFGYGPLCILPFFINELS